MQRFFRISPFLQTAVFKVTLVCESKQDTSQFAPKGGVEFCTEISSNMYLTMSMDYCIKGLVKSAIASVCIQYTYIHAYITLHYITLHTITYRTLHTLHYIALRYLTLPYITLQYITLHNITYITLHTLHYIQNITVHYITQVTLQYITYIT